MVFQNYALYPHLTVADNIAFGLRLRKTREAVIEERVAWAAKMLDLTPYLDRRPKQLSGGQRQRVAMGRAIVRQPQVFLMDEPLSNLDAKLRVQMRADIAKLQRDLGTTTIYVTHDQVEAMTMGDRVAVMSHGVLQQVDAPQRLYDEPANLFVAGFIGTPPMNLLEAGRLGRTATASTARRRRPAAPASTTRPCALSGAARRRGPAASCSASAPATCTSLRAARTCRADRAARARRGARRRSRSRTSASTPPVRPAPRASRRRRGGGRRRGRHRLAAEPRRVVPAAQASRPPLGRRRPGGGRRREGAPLRRARRVRRSASAARCAARASRRAAARPAAPRRRRPRPPSGRRARGARRSRRRARSIASQRIYFVMPDRYANGDPANDRGGRTGHREAHRLRPGRHRLVPRRRLRGLTGDCTDTGTRPRPDQGARLHRGLGDAAVRPEARCRASSAAYHGYWIRDFTTVDPHLGTERDFAAFVDCAHRLGLKVYLDVVVNHTARRDPAHGRLRVARARGEAVPRLPRASAFNPARYALRTLFPCLRAATMPRAAARPAPPSEPPRSPRG